MTKEIFFAYESGHQDNIDAIKKACSEYNSHQKSYYAKTWEELKVGGRIINKTILNAIDNCEIFACDLTYLNHNVLFEFGYAIAKKRKVLVFLNNSVTDAAQNYKDFRIFRNIGYKPFVNYKNILKELQGNKAHIQSHLLGQIIKFDKNEEESCDIFYITSKIKNQASLELTEEINSLGLKLISDDASEVEYQTLLWYIKSILTSKNVIIHLVGYDKNESSNENAESSFFAGFACGLGRKVLLVAPSPFKAPIDYEDILIEYSSCHDCVDRTLDWIIKGIEAKPALEVKEKATGDIQLNLLKLGIGCEIAEFERKDLLNYFIEIDAYHKAFSRNSSIFIGRKGSGKSAIFIKLESALNLDQKNYNVILRPDSDELLGNVELSTLYNNERSKNKFLKTIWQFVIFSKLILIINERLENKKEEFPHYQFSDDESLIVDFVKSNKDLVSLNFYGAINKIHEIYKGQRVIDNPNVLEPFYTNYLGSLIRNVKQYFSKLKYFNIYILADNLDKSWDEKSDLNLQSSMIFNLLEYCGKILNEIQSKENLDNKIHTIVFLRKDIFDFILKVSREPDKLTIQSYEITWERHLNLLRTVVDKRIEYILGLHNTNDVNNIWDKYFDINDNKHPYDIIENSVIYRPRDIIFFMSKLFEAAVNNSHEKVLKKDLDYAVDAYSNFLNKNLIAEMKAEFPKIENILIQLQRENIHELIDYNLFTKVLSDHKYSPDKTNSLLESLFKKEYLIGIIENTGEFLYDFNLLKLKLNERRFLFFHKYTIKLILSPMCSSIKYKKSLKRK